MKAIFSKAMALPLPFKGVLCMVMAGGIYGILMVAGFKQLAVFMGIALAVLGLVLAIVGYVMQKMDKGKAKAVEASLAENAAATPSGVSKVADRAKLDDLRRQFETGIQTFRDYGKDLYSMPWYAVVGEPGSGKTEAIRHSGIGFPPGLQDQLQGTGGTVNMNWWFTDHAVILDTAGRLMFEDVSPGENNEWREFLKLLRTVRPNCPMNGMLLVIPADTLITDTPDEIEKKAGKIAQQFDQIQRSLGVRFPVFVLITKSDLINGFREFFDDITDPVLTAQMLGWSNPAGLDEAFRPDKVEEHLKTVRERLFQRRFALLHDPVHTKDARGRRIDQVDALYKFPEALTELGPRLRRYLETIFVAGQWSQKPLFLRGIYFTSSMREGDALDADLASALGVGVEALPEGKLWERERSYFLRDVFLDKVFKERGLVTRAVNAGQVKRKRSAILLSAGVATALILAGLTWWSATETDRRISRPSSFWVSVREWLRENGDETANLTVINAPRGVSTRSFAGHEFVPDRMANPFRIEDSPRKYDEFFRRAREHYDENRASRGLFALVANLPGVGGSDVFAAQLPAQRRLFEELVVLPAVEAARDDLIGGPARRFPSREINWGRDGLAPRVLGMLLSMEAQGILARGRTPADFRPEEYRARLGELVRFAVGENRTTPDAGSPLSADSSEAKALDELTAYFEWLYGQDRTWPPQGAGAGGERSIAAIEAGLDAFIRQWQDPSGAGTVYGDLKTFADAAAAFGETERRLQSGPAFAGARTVEQYDDQRRRWLEAHDELRTRGAALRASFEKVRGHFASTGLASPATLPETARRSIWDAAEAEYDRLIAAFGAESELRDRPENQRLIEWRRRLVDAKSDAAANYTQLVDALIRQMSSEVFERYVRQPAGATEEAFAVRMKAYDLARGALEAPVEARGSVTDSFRAIQSETGRLLDGLGGLTPVGAPGVMGEAGDSIRDIIRAAARAQRHQAVRHGLDTLAGFKRSFESASEERLPEVRFAPLRERLVYKPEYRPAANEDVLGGYRLIRERVMAEGATDAEAVLDAASLRGRLEEVKAELDRHVRDYVRFWSKDVRDQLEVRRPDGVGWSEFHREIVSNQEAIGQQVRAVSDLIASAMDQARDWLDQDPEARAFAEATRKERETRDEIERRRRGMMRRWADLSGDTPRARDLLLIAAGGREFLEDFFPLRRTDIDPVTGPEKVYWDSFARAALEALEFDASGVSQRRVAEAERQARRFPITLDASSGNPLSAEEIRGVHEALAGLDLTAADRDPRAGRDPFDSYPESIATLLKRLRGDTIADSPRRASMLRDIREVAKFLTEQAGEVEFTLASLDSQFEGNRQVWTDFRQVRVASGGSPILFNQREYCNFEGAEVLTPYTRRLPLAQELELTFVATPGGEPTGRAVLRGWQPLAALVTPALDRNSFRNASADVWPLRLDMGGGRSFWMGVQFKDSEALRKLREAWPRESRWRD